MFADVPKNRRNTCFCLFHGLNTGSIAPPRCRSVQGSHLCSYAPLRSFLARGHPLRRCRRSSPCRRDLRTETIGWASYFRVDQLRLDPTLFVDSTTPRISSATVAGLHNRDRKSVGDGTSGYE